MQRIALAHVHLEDGAFTIEWVVIWTLIAAALIAVALYRLGGYSIPTRKLAVAAMCVAVGFAIFQIEIPVFGGVHINLTPLIGILAGPSLGTLAVLVINMFGAAIGHGGWGMIGANLLVNLIEVIVAYTLFRALKKIFSGAFARGGIATFVSLFCGNLAMIAIILISEVQGVNQSKSQILAGLSLIAGVNMVAAIIEAVITGMIITYILRMRPDMLENEHP